MKIGGMKVQNLYNNYNNKVKDDQNVSKNKIKDRIEISNEAKKLSSFENSKSVDNSKRIEELKTMIKNGTYKVDAKLTAESMMKSIKENRR
ncbi:MAG: flagellar biosynthesis anti-sigma factor FlgM [Clostridium sp.]|uniref:flagellar biosynthesis anti-sigma factor FlgM n=1 Tax=Clostridium TaxID=1485 RepID=UPI002152A5E8|nr:flagellar biosynthesis anti-sigma factor FlgM [Clostridium sp. LY3-2]MCR6513594.1 flagellar biosynthesis anti-sigma factor FlgM [Clostridium sp. LY3-2]